jgi:hypothetical protein
VRYITSTILLVLLSLPFVGTYSYLQHEKTKVRKQVKRHLMHHVDKSALVKLVFTVHESNTQLDWKHSREFQYNGEMYDIVDREVRGDSIHFWCWWDHEETALSKKLVALLGGMQKENPAQKNGQQVFLNFTKQLYIEEVSITPSNQVVHLIRKDIIHDLDWFEQIIIRPPTPPPEMFG